MQEGKWKTLLNVCGAGRSKHCWDICSCEDVFSPPIEMLRILLFRWYFKLISYRSHRKRLHFLYIYLFPCFWTCLLTYLFVFLPSRLLPCESAGMFPPKWNISVRGCAGQVRWLGTIRAANVRSLEWWTGDGWRGGEGKSNFLFKVIHARRRTNQTERTKEKKKSAPISCECGHSATRGRTKVALAVSPCSTMMSLLHVLPWKSATMIYEGWISCYFVFLSSCERFSKTPYWKLKESVLMQ